jgi:hypothetical protein
MHHKRRRPKNRRAGCLFCKPHKMNGISKLGQTKPSLCRTLQEDFSGRAPHGYYLTKLGK